MFIKLTKKEDRQPIWINSAYLVTFEPQRFGSLVVPLGDGFDYEVLETPEEILRMLSTEKEAPKEEQKSREEPKDSTPPSPPSPPPPPPPQEQPIELTEVSTEQEIAPQKEEQRPEFIDGTKEPRKSEPPKAKPLSKRRATRPSQIVRTRRASPARRRKFSEE